MLPILEVIINIKKVWSSLYQTAHDILNNSSILKGQLATSKMF